MERNYHFIKQRLANLKSIKPMLMSLRTISLSGWRLALKKMENLKAYQREMAAIGAQIGALPEDTRAADPQTGSCLLVLGSTRGLCGGFNRDLFTFFEDHSAEFAHTSEILLFGEKMGKIFHNHHVAFDHQLDYPRVNQLDFRFVSDLIAEYASTSKACQILYNSYHGSGQYQPAFRTIRWDHNPDRNKLSAVFNLIIDTDPLQLSEYLQRQNNLMEIYRIFLSSLAAEHSLRFQLMENAITNTDNLIRELGLMVQVERQKKITSEMRELSISAGLLDR
jgi:F-type H+-transporting ATPase subunit gamma